MRTLLLIFTIWLIIVVVRQHLADRRRAAESKPKPDKQLPADTVKCEHCGVYIPRQESVDVNDHHYCSQQHADLDQQ